MALVSFEAADTLSAYAVESAMAFSRAMLSACAGARSGFFTRSRRGRAPRNGGWRCRCLMGYVRDAVGHTGNRSTGGDGEGNGAAGVACPSLGRPTGFHGRLLAFAPYR